MVGPSVCHNFQKWQGRYTSKTLIGALVTVVSFLYHDLSVIADLFYRICIGNESGYVLNINMYQVFQILFHFQMYCNNYKAVLIINYYFLLIHSIFKRFSRGLGINFSLWQTLLNFEKEYSLTKPFLDFWPLFAIINRVKWEKNSINNLRCGLILLDQVSLPSSNRVANTWFYVTKNILLEVIFKKIYKLLFSFLLRGLCAHDFCRR